MTGENPAIALLQKLTAVAKALDTARQRAEAYYTSSGKVDRAAEALADLTLATATAKQVFGSLAFGDRLQYEDLVRAGTYGDLDGFLPGTVSPLALSIQDQLGCQMVDEIQAAVVRAGLKWVDEVAPTVIASSMALVGEE